MDKIDLNLEEVRAALVSMYAFWRSEHFTGRELLAVPPMADKDLPDVPLHERGFGVRATATLM